MTMSTTWIWIVFSHHSSDIMLISLQGVYFVIFNICINNKSRQMGARVHFFTCYFDEEMFGDATIFLLRFLYIMKNSKWETMYFNACYLSHWSMHLKMSIFHLLPFSNYVWYVFLREITHRYFNWNDEMSYLIWW